MKLLLSIAVLFAIAVITVILPRELSLYLRWEHNTNKKSRDILGLVKTNNPAAKELIFNHDIQPDFSGYLN